MYSIKKLFLEILENLQKNICVRVLYYIDFFLSKNIWNNFQDLLFKKLLAQSGDQTDMFWKFYLPVDTLWLPKTVGRVLGTPLSLVNQLLKAVIRLVMIGSENICTTSQNSQMLQHHYGQCNKKDEANWEMIGKQLAMIIT